MPLLQVRNCPSNLYESITQVAKKENRSIAQQTIVLLEQSFQHNMQNAKKTSRLHALERSASLNFSLPKTAQKPEELIREDRNR